LQELQNNIDPTDYMPPSIREVARMDMQTLKSEYDLVIAKQSERSSSQRRWIQERYEFELTKLQAEAEQTQEDDSAQ
jgi:ElaB/YqjD/DUF883 family membrane-anchored ribosome-binding protein